MVLVLKIDFPGEGLINFLQVWENDVLSFLGFLHLFFEEVEALLQHDCVVTFESYDRREIFDEPRDS